MCDTVKQEFSFSPEDRKRIFDALVKSVSFVDAGTIAITAFISPYRVDRDDVRNILEDGNLLKFIPNVVLKNVKSEILKVYMQKHVQEIKEFTGISAPYEAPNHPEITINTEQQSVEQAVAHILNYLTDNKYL